MAEAAAGQGKLLASARANTALHNPIQANLIRDASHHGRMGQQQAIILVTQVGMGINLDDVMAGVYGALVLFLAGWFNLY